MLPRYHALPWSSRPNWCSSAARPPAPPSRARANFGPCKQSDSVSKATCKLKAYSSCILGVLSNPQNPGPTVSGVSWKAHTLQLRTRFRTCLDIRVRSPAELDQIRPHGNLSCEQNSTLEIRLYVTVSRLSNSKLCKAASMRNSDRHQGPLQPVGC